MYTLQLRYAGTSYVELKSHGSEEEPWEMTVWGGGGGLGVDLMLMLSMLL